MQNANRNTKERSETREVSEEDLSRGLVTILDPASGASEDYRTIRTNLLYALVDNPPKVIVLTSHGPGEGKSTTCANLGVVLAQAAKRTLILDCDLRKPAIHKFFGLRNLHGIVDVLVGERGLQEIWQEPMEGLKVVPAGPIPPNPAEILGSQRFSKFLASVRKGFHYVLVDASPIGPVSDPVVLATLGDGVLLVLDAQNTRKESVRQAMHSLQAVGANVLGTVMNNVKPNKNYYSGNYYDGYVYGKR
jgi:capsular exopolysaccharide synthesis family protein